MKAPAPNQIRFELLNGLTESDVKGSNFVIYAHSCPHGLYVGLAQDPVKRWQQHLLESFAPETHRKNEAFKTAVRAFKGSFKHYILAVAKFEKAAHRKEAAAIEFYKPELNSREEKGADNTGCRFKQIKGQTPIAVILKIKGRFVENNAKSDSDRTSIIANVIKEGGRIRLACAEGQPFAQGLRIECSREERSNLQPGSQVRIKVALAKDGKFLVAARSASIVLVDK